MADASADFLDSKGQLDFSKCHTAILLEQREQSQPVYDYIVRVFPGLWEHPVQRLGHEFQDSFHQLVDM